MNSGNKGFVLIFNCFVGAGLAPAHVFRGTTFIHIKFFMGNRKGCPYSWNS